MKNPIFILSHICVFAVFAVGASIAYLVSKGVDDSPEIVSTNAMLRDGGRETNPRGNNAQDSSTGHSRGDREGPGRTSRQAVSPVEALGKINGMTDTFSRQRALMNFLDDLAPEDFEEVANEFGEQIHYDNGNSEMALLFQAWAKTNPLAALDYIERNPRAARNRDEVIATWAGSDPSAAERWAISKHDGDGVNPYMAAVVRGIALQDIDKAYELTGSMVEGRERGQAINFVSRALLMKGNETAFEFSESIEDGHLKGSFVSIISENLARTDPQAAADWVASMKDGTIQNRAAGEIAQRLARQDIGKATEFVSSLQPEARSKAAAATIPTMSRDDIAGTAEWVSTLAGSPNYDIVVESFVWSCDERAPEQSAAWIRAVADPQQQTRLYYRMLSGWAKKDAGAVKSWVAENEVPAAVRKRFSR